ncbi:MAG: hypothetical protein JXR36_08515 [Bacteroidales bacterium]|nr:hypothetical protein [Bacteroidales bacterium]
MKKNRTIVVFALTLLLLSCNVKNKWEKARVVFYDDFEKEMFIKVSKHSYYNFIKAKDDITSKTLILIPEEIKLVESSNNKYMRLYFDEETYGMESYSFGHSLGGDEIMIAQTKYQAKTCACKTSGTYFKGYFLVYNDSVIKIKTDNKDNVYNRAMIYEFVEKHNVIGFTKDINTITDIINFLENINN